MPLQLREYQKNDFIALKNIIRKTWRYDEFSSPKTASRLADVFLRSCLTNYTFSRVAVLNGKPVGIILVRISRVTRVRFQTDSGSFGPFCRSTSPKRAGPYPKFLKTSRG